ncbi:MAG: rnhB [Chlamydiia bacterium]|nr:rnhB [Chlamydiia bacterium]
MSERDIFERASLPKDIHNLHIERRLWASGFTLIAGVDEVGRGPLAGPVVAAACILPPNVRFPSIKDSKVLSEKDRKKIYKSLTKHPKVIWAVSIVDHQTIDQINILRATLLAMKQAVEALPSPPDFVLIDGCDSPPLSMPHQAVIKGDSLSQSIGAASIIAKVTRDSLMEKLHLEFPQYGFDEHKGYGTKAHLRAIEEHGVLPVHRKTFGPVARKLLNNSTDQSYSLF